MPRISRNQVMENNKDHIISYFLNADRRTYTLDDTNRIMEELKDCQVILKTTKLSDFQMFLIKNEILSFFEIELPRRTTSRFVFGEPSVYELAVGINKKSYLSHYSAVYLHNLTNNLPKKIFTNVEQAVKYRYSPYDPDELEQKNIDLAFSRPMRETNQIAELKIDASNKYKIYMLNGKNHGQVGVGEIDINGISLPITTIERTLIDIVVRPNYAGGVNEVLYAFTEAKGKISVNKLLSVLNKMNFIYPYYQLIGFYLEKAGYPESTLKLFKQYEIKYNFYLTYQMKDKEFSERWRVYYPKGF